MKRQDDQFVGGQFDWFIGVVEDNLDQQGRNRVKVRCFGYHTEDKAELPTKDLPYATVMMPTTGPSVEGIGMNHQLLTGSWVVGFFRDGPSAQDPIVMGSIGSFTSQARDPNLGFSGAYGNKAGVFDRPAEVDPFNNLNQVTKTVAGHLVELDNQPFLERLSVTHGTNESSLTIDQKGIITVISNGEGTVFKQHRLILDPDLNQIRITHDSGTQIKILSEGTVEISSANDTVNIKGNTTVTGTIHATGDISTDAGNAPTLATHTHTEVPGTGGSSSPIPGTQETSVAN